MVTSEMPLLQVSEATFYDLCSTNPDLRLELTSGGELIVMPPTGGETGEQNDEMSYQLRTWNKRTGLGKCFNAATGFRLPSGANRSPDGSWVSLDRWQSLTPQQRRGFPPLAPDFVFELRSPTDKLETLQKKMEEYQQNGVRLGWLIDPEEQSATWRVEIYRFGQGKEVLESPKSLSGEGVLPGFELDLSGVFGRN
ncbi:MAG: Uma2 family endonuclease [Coleofasciculaceae cyanobacterium]